MKGFLLDEHISRRLGRQLASRVSVPVLMVGEPGAPKAGTSDQGLLAWCEEREFMLVTANRRSMQRHLDAHCAAGRHVPGVVSVRLDAPMLEDLFLIAEASFEEEHRDRILYLPL